MPRITLVGVPSPGASAVDYESGTHLVLGASADVDDATVARLCGVEPIGYRFEVDQENAPAGPAGEPTQTAGQPASTDAPLAQ